MEIGKRPALARFQKAWGGGVLIAHLRHWLTAATPAPPVFTTGIEWPRSRIKCGTNFWSSSHSTSCNNSSSTQAAFTSLLPGPAPICCCPVPASPSLVLGVKTVNEAQAQRKGLRQHYYSSRRWRRRGCRPSGVGWRGRRSVENGSFFVCLFATEQNFPHGGSTRHFRIARFWNTEAHTHTNK